MADYITDTILAIGAEAQLVGINADSVLLEKTKDLTGLQRISTCSTQERQNEVLSDCRYDLRAVARLAPDVVLLSADLDQDLFALSSEIKTHLALLGSEQVKVYHYAPGRLQDVYDLVRDVGKHINCAARGHDLAQRYQSQILDWVRNFYDRMHHKRVTFIAGIDPLVIAGGWIGDMIFECACSAQLPGGLELLKEVCWQDIVDFRPDVLLVALKDRDKESTLKCFKHFEKLGGWDDLQAVRRGEVFFADGESYFFRPGPAIVGSMGILVSVIAGMDSGYITPRDSFYRLRWLELMRHKF